MPYLDPTKIQQLENWEFWGIVVIAIIINIISLWAFVRNFKYARLIEDTPTSKIRSAAQGFVELEGRGVYLTDTPIISPLTGKHCIWYKYEIEKQHGTGKNKSWRTVESGSSSHPIVLEDTTGKCILQLKGASIHAVISNTWQGMQRKPSPLSVERQDSMMQFGQYRYHEELIIENSPLYALGHFKTTRSTDNFTKSQAVGQLISEWKSDYQSLLHRFDKNKDGEIDEKEWKLVRLAAELEAEDLEKQLNSEPEIHIMEKPIKGLPYLIGTEDQSKFASTFKWYSAFALAAFLLACGSIAWLLQVRGI